jgi:uncharacterized protein YyaL (SSP411 family)
MLMRTNLLGLEKSPYLQQHAKQPVHWQPYGEAAFAAAKAENKPVFLSVGYATCHWCHVMAHESFDDAEVAAVLNEHFICIKLDREERPDVDQVFMQALHVMRGQGGWPLSVFLTPEGAAFYAGTYFPKAVFLRLLEQVRLGWINEQARFLEVGASVMKALQRDDTSRVGSTEVPSELHSLFVEACAEVFDSESGGFGAEPKFPPVEKLRYLLRFGLASNAEVKLMVELTLRRMAYGGIYDQLRGGFARYSTDAEWAVPHFEKMLYDNAQLSTLYLEAYLQYGDAFYLAVAEEILNYLLEDMQHAEGGFYAAEDADSEIEGRAVEGAFYVWSVSALCEVLTPEEYTALSQKFNIQEHGNFEDGQNVLILSAETAWQNRWGAELAQARVKLLVERGKRARPLRDEKILVGWNGLVIEALSLAWAVTQKSVYREAAERAALFIERELCHPDTLLRRHCAGENKFEAVLEDYAYFTQGLLSLYRYTLDARWFAMAQRIMELQDRRLWNAQKNTYNYSADASLPIINTLQDDACPNPQAVSASNLFELAMLGGDAALAARAADLLIFLPEQSQQYPPAFARGLRALEAQRHAPGTLVLTGTIIAEDIFPLLAKAHCAGLSVARHTAGQGPKVADSLPYREGELEFHICNFDSCSQPQNGMAALAAGIEALRL